MIMKTILLGLLIWGQDIQVKSEYSMPVGTMLVITPETKGTDVKWVPLQDGLQILDSNLLKDKRQLVVTSNKVGTYRMLTYTSIDNKPSEPVFVTIKVGSNIIPPTPVELRDMIVKAYKDDTTPDKVECVSKMIEGFKGVLVDMNSINTNGDLNLLMSQKITNKMGPMCIRGVRNIIKEELTKQFGTDSDIILDKPKATQVIQNIINILGVL